MNKKLIFVIIGGLIIFTIIMNVIIMSLETRKEQLANPIPTLAPTPTSVIRLKKDVPNVPTQPPKLPLAVKSTTVSGGTTEASLLPDIDITFNQPVSRDSFIFAIDPSEPYEITFSEATASVRFVDPLSQGVTYRYRINTFNQLPREYLFTTEDTTPKDEIILRYKPEMYAHERTPFENDIITITSEYVAAKGRYRFDVRGKIRDEDTIREATREWFLRIGLDEAVFKNFWIIYWE